MKSQEKCGVPVIGFEGIYSISDFGRLKRISSWKNIKAGTILNTYRGENMYRSTTLRKDNKSNTVLIHRLVAIHFIPNPNNKPCVNHIDGDKSNANKSNLDWVTYSENHSHAYNIGLRVKPPVGNLSKLTWDQVKEMRLMRDHLHERISKKYKIGLNQVIKILNNKQWVVIAGKSSK